MGKFGRRGWTAKACCITAWVAALALTTLATGQDETSNVTSSEEFLNAVRGGATYIIITEHLDLRQVQPDRASSKEGPAVTAIVPQQQIVIQGQCEGAVESSKELVGQQLYPPLPRSGPQRKPQQCVLVVDRGLFEFQGASTGVWLDNVFIALRRGSSSTAGRSMQVLSFDRCDAWLTDVTLSGDAWVARALLSLQDTRVHAQGFQGARPPESAAAVASAPGSTSNARRLQQAGPPPLRGLLDALTAAPTDDPDIPELVADEYYEEYEPFGGNEDGGPLQGVAPVADVRHNSSLVLEECLVEGNNVRHADGAVISISAAASDYDDSDFPCSVAVRGGVVQSSFSTRADSNRVLFVTMSASAGTFYTDLEGAQVFDLETNALFEPKSFSAAVEPFDAVMLMASDNPLSEGSTSCRSCSSVAQVGQPAEPPPLASEATSGADTTSGGESSGGKGIAAWVIALVTCVLGLLIALLGGIIVMQLRRKDRDKGNTLATASRATKHDTEEGAASGLATASSVLQSATPSWWWFNRDPNAVSDLEGALDALHCSGTPLCQGYRLLPATERRVGGQGVVQFASLQATTSTVGEGGARDSCDIVAIKFYLSKRTFDTERLLHGDMDVQCHMPATLSMHDNSSSSVKTASGYVLPPFVVMQRGQTLDEWARENRSPDFVAVFNVLCYVAQALKALHSAGYAHRNLKPSNILHRPTGCSDWTFIDFGCAARVGEKARLVCNLAYAAPEIVHAAEGAKRAVVVDSAADIWALGVIAFELLAGELTFPQFPQRGDIAEAKRVSKLICDSVSGRTELPWEGGGAEARRRTDQLRALKRTVLKCLSRDPRRRPTAVQLLHAWDNIFDHVQTHGTDWGHTPSDALTSTAATVPPAATSSTTPRTHTYANTQTLSGSPPLCSLPVGSSPQGTSQCDAFANHTGTHTNAQQHTDSGHPAHGTGAVVTQQFLGETAATAATSPPITRHEEVDTESVSSEASPRDVNNTAPLGLVQVSVARPGRRQPQCVPGWNTGSIYNPPGTRATQPSSIGPDNMVRPVAGSSAPPSGGQGSSREEIVVTGGSSPNGVMHASEAAQAAVQAVAHEAHARVPQPAVPPVLVQAPSLGITSARGSSTEASNNRTNSQGANKVLSRGQRTQ